MQTATSYLTTLRTARHAFLNVFHAPRPPE